jgi:hypothetical protein
MNSNNNKIKQTNVDIQNQNYIENVHVCSIFFNIYCRLSFLTAKQVFKQQHVLAFVIFVGLTIFLIRSSQVYVLTLNKSLHCHLHCSYFEQYNNDIVSTKTGFLKNVHEIHVLWSVFFPCVDDLSMRAWYTCTTTYLSIENKYSRNLIYYTTRTEDYTYINTTQILSGSQNKRSV